VNDTLLVFLRYAFNYEAYMSSQPWIVPSLTVLLEVTFDCTLIASQWKYF